jgi:hypothetical protein
MWSTLKGQRSLRKVKEPELFMRKLFPFFFRRAPHYMLVRNPYDRLVSFFKNKLRRSVDTTSNWQSSQKIFFREAGVTRGDSDSVIHDKLKAYSFEAFIRSLPRTYRKNAHLYPQNWAECISPCFLGWRSGFQRIFKMESQKDMEDLAEYLELDFGYVNNSTKAVPAQTDWNTQLKSIVKEVYRDDFRQYGYSDSGS